MARISPQAPARQRGAGLVIETRRPRCQRLTATCSPSNGSAGARGARGLRNEFFQLQNKPTAAAGDCLRVTPAGASGAGRQANPPRPRHTCDVWLTCDGNRNSVDVTPVTFCRITGPGNNCERGPISFLPTPVGLGRQPAGCAG